MKKRKAFFAIASIIILLSVLIYYFFLAERNLLTSDTAIIVGNEKISLGEFKMYLYEVQRDFENQGESDIWEYDFEGGKTALEVAKESAVNSIVYAKISGQYAKTRGIKLSETEAAASDAKAYEAYNSLPEQIKSQINITYEQCKKIHLETALYYKVYDSITDGIIFSDSDFEQYLAEYIETRPYDYISEDEVRENYIHILKKKIFDDEFAKWSSNISMLKNEELIHSVQLLK